MKNIKLFTLKASEDLDGLEERVNKFMQDKNIADIKFSSGVSKSDGELEWTQDILVIYEKD